MSKRYVGMATLACLIAGSALCTGQYRPVTQQTVLRAPASGASFVAPDEQQAGDEAAFRKQVLGELAEIKKLLKQVLEEEPEPEAPAKATAGENVLAAGLSKCLGCHTPKEAPKKGDRFVLFSGDKGNEFREDFRRSELKAIEEKVKDGTMPKKSAGLKLTAEEKAAIVAEVAARRAELEK